ncbi:MAG: PucR family transcriptional regulator [Acetanaerobacterium sp.]
MDFLVRNIIELNLFEGARIVAGDKGINNKIRWVNVMEILDSPDSMQKHEMLVTTGYRMDDEKQHKDLIERLGSRGVSGIAIQPGYYIDEIPQYVIDEANRYGLPVLVLPKELTFSHIMHVLLENINCNLAPEADGDYTTLRERLLKQNPLPFDAAPTARRVLFMAAPSYANPAVSAQQLALGISRIRSLLQTACARVWTESAGSKTLFAAQLHEGASFETLLLELSNQLMLLVEHEQLNLLMGATLLMGGDELSVGFSEAVQSAELLKKTGAKRGVCPFHNMALFEMFERIHKSSRAVMLADETLRKLFEYDRRKGSDYVHTLRMYLANEGSLVNTSAALFIHRHTLKNRLARIEVLCGVKLTDYYSRLQLSISLFICDHFAF